MLKIKIRFRQKAVVKKASGKRKEKFRFLIDFIFMAFSPNTKLTS